MENLKVMHLDAWKEEFTEDECNFSKVEEYLNLIKEFVKRFDSSRYSEWHHVMPRCVDKDHKYGSEGIRINGADHFRAHLKLVECFNSTYMKRNLQYAVVKMVPQEIKYSECTGEDYERSRLEYSKLQAEVLVDSGNPFYGKTHSDESKKKISESKKKPTDEARKHISESQIKRLSDPRNHPMYGKHHSEESKLKMSISHRNMTEQTREKMRQSAKGNTSHKGFHHSEEVQRKLREARKGISPPNKGKIAINNGINNKYISDSDPIPDGWFIGMAKRKKVQDI